METTSPTLVRDRRTGGWVYPPKVEPEVTAEEVVEVSPLGVGSAAVRVAYQDYPERNPHRDVQAALPLLAEVVFSD